MKKRLSDKEIKALLFDSFVETCDTEKEDLQPPAPLPPGIARSLKERGTQDRKKQHLSVGKALGDIFSGLRDLVIVVVRKFFPRLSAAELKTSLLLKSAVLLLGLIMVVLIGGLPLYGTFYLLTQTNLIRRPSAYPADQPSTVKYEKTKISIYNNAGDPLYALELTPGQQRFSHYETDNFSRYYAIKALDLRRPWEKSLLFLLNDESPGKEGADLVIFTQGNSSPKIINLGEYLEFPENPEESRNTYHLDDIRVDDLNYDGLMEIIVSTMHKKRYSSQIYVLDHEGEIIMRYTNAGAICWLETIDVDGDGTKEVIGSGTDNYPDCNRAMAVGFSPFNQENLPYGSIEKSRIYDRAEELSRVKFFLMIEQTPLGAEFRIRNAANRIEHLMSPHSLLIIIGETVPSHIDLLYTIALPDFKVLKVETGDIFEGQLRNHVPGFVVDEAYKNSLKKNVRLWDQSAKTFIPVD